MAHYRCYLLSADGSIVKAQDTDCADDASAFKTAKELYGSKPFEIWQGVRLVHVAMGEQRETVKT